MSDRTAEIYECQIKACHQVIRDREEMIDRLTAENAALARNRDEWRSAYHRTEALMGNYNKRVTDQNEAIAELVEGLRDLVSDLDAAGRLCGETAEEAARVLIKKHGGGDV